MISLLEHRADGDLFTALGAARSGPERQPVPLARIVTQYAAYTCRRGALDAPRFYRAGEGALLSVFDGAITVDSVDFDPAELWEFARWNRCDRIIGPGEAANRLLHAPDAARGRLTQHSLERCPALCYGGPAFPEDPEVWRPVRPEEVFALLQAVFDGMRAVTFDGWYADLSLKRQCGRAFIAGLYDGGGLCSTAAISYSMPGAAVIGSVATRPDRRGQGLASRLVRAVTGRIRRMDSAAYIVSQTDAANRIYERLGFARCGVYCELGVALPGDEPAESIAK